VNRTAVLNVVGLTPSLIGPHTLRMREYARRGRQAVLEPVFPAVTCTAQSTYLTGLPPSQHGIVGNGWYHRELAEVQFWKQSNRLVHGRKVWEELRTQLDAQSPGTGSPRFTCAKLFWWFNMYSSADWSITPRPIYPADGRKVFDIYAAPSSLGDQIKRDLGEFPFPTFWGPAAGVPSPQGPPDAASRWIARAAVWIEERFQPTLSLVYLPHLDYNLQRFGPNHRGLADDLRAIDSIVGELLDFFHSRGVQVILLSEYGITEVNTPVHLNRAFRHAGWIAIRDELGLERLDCGASRVFAVADHQVAHVYLNDPALESAARELIESQPGVARVLDADGKEELGIDHPRSGDLIALAAENAWFTYYYWLDDALAPDFARTVDIHRKPGYDPVELFVDPKLQFPKLKIAGRLLRKKLGLRMLMDVIPLDATLVRGSHGVRPADPKDWPVLITRRADLVERDRLGATDICALIRRAILSEG
jgi:predicted AlkP superfamily pyrophosphatase or phosphodiesterase